MCTQDEIKKKDLLESYERILDIYKLQNDNYFKRVQVFMTVLQGGLFAVALNAAFNLVDSRVQYGWNIGQQLESVSLMRLCVLVIISVLGCLSARLWARQHSSNKQYLEFSRTHLRNIEIKGKVGTATY